MFCWSVVFLIVATIAGLFGFFGYRRHGDKHRLDPICRRAYRQTNDTSLGKASASLIKPRRCEDTVNSAVLCRTGTRWCCSAGDLLVAAAG